MDQRSKHHPRWLEVSIALLGIGAMLTGCAGPLPANPTPPSVTPPTTSPPSPPIPDPSTTLELSEPQPGSRLLDIGATATVVTLLTAQPSEVRADTSDKPFSEMTLKLEASSSGKTHTLTAKLEGSQPLTLYFRAAPQGKPDQPYATLRRANYRAATAYNPPFPRVFTLWWPKWGNWTDATAAKLSKLSVFIYNLHGYGLSDGFKPIDPSVFAQARGINPNLRILTQLYSTYGCGDENDLCDDLERLDADSSQPDFHKRVFIRNADGSVFRYGPHVVYNFTNPKLVAWLVEKNLELWRNDLVMFDGAFMDNCWRGLQGVNDGSGSGTERNLDLDLNGVADDQPTRDRAYELGLQDFLKGLRAGMPNALILCNAIGRFPDRSMMYDEGQLLTDRDGKPFNYADIVNGNEFESEPNGASEGGWPAFDELMRWYKGWNERANPSVNLLPNKIVSDDSSTPDKAYRTLRQMRYSLAAALMGDGVFLHGGWEFYTWFDEYDAKLGYSEGGFGAPVSSGNPVWRRDFDGGIALVNSSQTETITVELGGTFKAIAGTQDPQVNDGKAVSSVTIPPLDGRILLR
jgi:Hypothetical glycosyl hydrolase family 15